MIPWNARKYWALAKICVTLWNVWHIFIGIFEGHHTVFPKCYGYSEVNAQLSHFQKTPQSSHNSTRFWFVYLFICLFFIAVVLADYQILKQQISTTLLIPPPPTHTPSHPHHTLNSRLYNLLILQMVTCKSQETPSWRWRASIQGWLIASCRLVSSVKIGIQKRNENDSWHLAYTSHVLHLHERK